MTAAPDVRFWFDPVCPFAWLTSRWVRTVQSQRDLAVEWRFISLRLLNAHIDYDSHFPPEYEAGHSAGLRMLRVFTHVRDDHGDDAVTRLYPAVTSRVLDVDPDQYDPQVAGTVERVMSEALAEVGLPEALVERLDDTARDPVVQAETDEALALSGKDVGTPILQIAPGSGGGDGVAFFGPVISRLPSEEDAGRLWDHVVGLATFPGFSELKRSLRERPQLRGFGVADGGVGLVEDWHGGSRRQQR